MAHHNSKTVALIPTSHTGGSRLNLWQRLAKIWRNFNQRQHITPLRDMSERELADIALDRTDIDCALNLSLRQSPTDYLAKARDNRVRRLYRRS